MRLLDKRYEEIKKIVVSLFTELNLDDVPIDCFKICNLLEIKLVKYSDVSEKNVKLVKHSAKTAFAWKLRKTVKVFFTSTMMTLCMIAE